MSCAHENFRCEANIGRLTKGEGGPVTGYSADIKVACSECGLPFRFVGLAAGNHHSEPRVSIDGTELRAPIEPALNRHYGTTYRWKLILNHNVNRLMLGHLTVDLHDSEANGLASCRDAIDAEMDRLRSRHSPPASTEPGPCTCAYHMPDIKGCP